MLVPSENLLFIWLRYAAGTAYVAFLPGYVLARLILPLRFQTESENPLWMRVEQVAFGVGLSFAVTGMVGLTLNYSPWGIRLFPIVFALLLITVLLGTVGVVVESRKSFVQNSASRTST